MKKYSEYSDRPETFIKYDDTHTLINYNVLESTRVIDGQEYTYYTCEYIIVDDLSRGNIVNQLIRTKYTLSEELSILRQRDSKPEEFREYNEYAELCKNIAEQLFNK